MTIPLSITLSEINLSAFIILVFSKQKGLTLVFRNDPLESLKVSSTFDSIQFVREYLQRTIEQQLRNLMMDELPAIIHRLSLQLWCPDQANKDGFQTPQEDLDVQGADPFASPPEDPVDSHGNLLDQHALSELALNGGTEMQSLFSQKNLLRLSALTDSHRTLSLFTPGMKDVVFRAWTGYDWSEGASPPFATPSLARANLLSAGGSTTYTFSDSGSTSHGHQPSRPSLVHMNSAKGSLGYAAGHRSRPGRKKKTRVVNLRKSKSEAGSVDGLSEDGSDTASVNMPSSEPVMCGSVSEEPESVADSVAEGQTGKVRFHTSHKDHEIPIRKALMSDIYKKKLDEVAAARNDSKSLASVSSGSIQGRAAEKAPATSGKETPRFRDTMSGNSDTSSVILEQAWIMKMAGEIARRVYDEKNRHQGTWEESESPPPPAYEATSH